MSKVRFVLNNLIDVSDLSNTVGDVDPNYPVDNLTLISRSKVLRTTNTLSPLEIKGTVGVDGDAIPVSSAIISKHNFSSSITYQIVLYSDYNYSNSIYISPVYLVSENEAASDFYKWGEFNWGEAPWGGNKKDFDNRNYYDILLWLDSVYNAKSFKITIAVVGETTSNFIYASTTTFEGAPLYCNNTGLFCSTLTSDGQTSNPFFIDDFSITIDRGDITIDMLTLDDIGGTSISGLQYYEINRIYLGEYREPTYGISKNHTIEWVENTRQYRPSSGTLRSDLTTTSNRSFKFTLATIPETDFNDLHQDIVDKSINEDFYLSMFPEDDSFTKIEDFSGPVKLTKAPKYTEFLSGYYKSAFNLEEI